MISKYICNAVLKFRNAHLQSQMNSIPKSKLILWTELKLFHAASVSCNRRKLIIKKKEPKNLNKKPLKVWRFMTVKELAEAMNIDFSYLSSFYPLLNLTPDTRLKSLHIFTSLAHKLGWKFILVKCEEKAEKKTKKEFQQPPSKPENLVKRPPVVTVMGHVDHGKTTLLDSLRNSFITQEEFGGITQHIGAFSVEVAPGVRITFIDTPGHAAFTAMRARGAEITDIVVLVIAADDGVMQQTVESIKIANAAEVHVIVAVNKIDKPSALPIDEIKKKLLTEGIQVEDQGGDVQLVPISALKKINLDLLTEVILLEAELMNLRGDPTGLVEGVIIESKKDKLGIVATLIVKRGTLRKEKILVAGVAHARVRRMLDENGKDYKEALPSTPVQVFGWKELPVAGDKVIEVLSEKQATALMREEQNQLALEKQKIDQEVIKKKHSQHQKEHYERQKLFNSISSRKERRKHFFQEKLLQEKTKSTADIGPHLNVILKGDVYGTLEVLEDILESYDKNEECKLNIINASVGDIKQNDLEIAETTGAIIFAFNVKLHETATDLFKKINVNVRYHNIIYKLIDDLKEELNLRIPSVFKEKINGEAEVIQNFMITYASKKVPVAGSKCTQGQLIKESLFKVLRKEEVIFEGTLIEMRHEKNIVKTITKGMHCGLLFNSFSEKFVPGDKIICYDKVEVQRKTSWSPGF